MTILGSEGIAGLKFEICMIMTGILREFEVFQLKGFLGLKVCPLNITRSQLHLPLFVSHPGCSF